MKGKGSYTPATGGKQRGAKPVSGSPGTTGKRGTGGNTKRPRPKIV